MTDVYYIAGPMSGYPQFNFPQFFDAAEAAEDQGYEYISPAELDAENNADYQIAINSTDGAIGETSQTWGDYLSRDVKVVSDQCNGIIFLPNWEESKGARLEAYVALACGYTKFLHYIPEINWNGFYDRKLVVAGVLHGIR